MAWPTREEWAKHRTTVYADMDNPKPASTRLSDYATPDEIEAATAALKRLYGEYGRQMKAAKPAAAHLLRQPGESKADHVRRYIAMTDEERDLAEQVHQPRYCRTEINDCLRELKNDVVPWRWYSAIPLPPELGLILARHKAAERAADEAWARDVAATPVDDAAWERELKSRMDRENYLIRLRAGKHIQR